MWAGGLLPRAFTTYHASAAEDTEVNLGRSLAGFLLAVFGLVNSLRITKHASQRPRIQFKTSHGRMCPCEISRLEMSSLAM